MKISRNQISLAFFALTFLGIQFFYSCREKTWITSKQKNEIIQPEIILGLNAYSFEDLLVAKDRRDKEQIFTLYNLLDWCDYKGIKALDPTAYFFPSYPEAPSDEYIEQFKKRAAELNIILSGTGIRNNFTSADPKVRAEGVELAKKWIVVAAKLEVPVLRCFAGEIPATHEEKWEEVASWAIACYKELIPFAEKYKIKIGIQNHGDLLRTAEECLYILKRVDSDWAGIIVDTGNFVSEDPYEDIKKLVPYAVNWQVKEFMGGYGGTEKTDYYKLIKIIKEGGYKGIVPVETLKVRGQAYDPFQRVDDMMNNLEDAIKMTYSEAK